MKEKIDLFIAKSTARKSNAPLGMTTRNTYRVLLRQLAGWLERKKIPYPALTGEQLLAFLDSQKDWSNSYKWQMLCAARRFYEWEFGPDHMVCSVNIKRIDPGPQRTLKEHQVSKLLDSFDPKDPKDIRDKAIVALMVDTGIRANELVTLTMSNLDMLEWSIQVLVGKGGGWQPSAFFDYTAECLQAWLAIRPQYVGKAVNTVFVSIKGLKPGRPITRDGLRAIFRRMGKQSGLGLISPHDLRRTFATLAISNGASSRIVQVAGHWKSLAMVDRYTRALNVKAIQPFSPVNQVMGIFRAKHRG